MKRIAKLATHILFTSALILTASRLMATDFTWVGTTSNLNLNTNWNPNTRVPTAGDTGTFTAAGMHNPTLSSGSAFSIDLIDIVSTSYSFSITDPNTIFTFAGFGSGPDFGFKNDSISSQSFQVINQATMNFENFCSADCSTGSNPGNVTYQIGDSGNPGNLNFAFSSTASTAKIIALGGSTVNFIDNSSVGTSTITLTNTADTLNLAQSVDTTFDAFLDGAGTVNKNSSNYVNVLSDNASFAGKTNVNAGNLALNNVLGGNVIVNSSGILSGIGMVGNNLNVNSGGTVSPGNSIGRLTVIGNTIQMPNSTLQIEVDGAGNASNLLVGGQASINVGSSVKVVPTVTQLEPNQSFTAPILTSFTGVSGTYSTVNSVNPLIAVSVFNDPNNVFLTWTNTFALIGRTANQRKVTDQLQTITHPSPIDFTILSELASLSEKKQQHALQQLTAQPYANLLLTAELANHKFIQRIYNPLRPLVTSHPCCMPECCDCHCCQFDTWFDGGWTHNHLKGNRNARGLDTKGYEISLGTQATFDNCWTIGLAGSYEKDHLRYEVGGKGRSNTYLGALYTLFRPADYYFLGDAVLGYTQNRIKRHIDIGPNHFKARGRPDIFQGTGYLEFGKDLALDCFLFQPFIGVEGSYLRHDHINEHRSHNLFTVNVRNRIYGTASSRLGLHLLTELSCLKLYVDAAWQYRLTSRHNDSRQRFREFGDAFTITGIPLARNSLDSAINLSATIVQGWEIYVEAQGQFWKNASSYSALGGMIISW